MKPMEQEDGFLESVDSLIKTLRQLIVKPVQKITGLISTGILLVVLLFLAFVFLFIGIIKILQGLGLFLGINPTGFAFGVFGLVFLFLSGKSYWRKK